MQGKSRLGAQLGGCAALQECGRAASLHGSHLFQCGQPGDAVNCSDKQYEHKGRCCNRCQPGTKMPSPPRGPVAMAARAAFGNRAACHSGPSNYSPQCSRILLADLLPVGESSLICPHQPFLQGRSWPLNATTRKALSAHPVRTVTTSRAGLRRGTARPMTSVRTVSAPCPQRVGLQGLHSTQAHPHCVPTPFDRRWPRREETRKRDTQHSVPVPGRHALL